MYKEILHTRVDNGINPLVEGFPCPLSKKFLYPRKVVKLNLCLNSLLILEKKKEKKTKKLFPMEEGFVEKQKLDALPFPHRLHKRACPSVLYFFKDENATKGRQRNYFK